MASICTKSPSKEMIQRMYKKRLASGILKQEVHYAKSNAPISRLSIETKLKIEAIQENVQEIKRRVSHIDNKLNSIEAKVDKLELKNRSLKNHHLIHRLSRYPRTMSNTGPITPPPSPSEEQDSKLNLSKTCMSPSIDLIIMQLSKSWENFKAESIGLQGILRENSQILKFKRAEKCSLSVKKLGRQINNLEMRFSNLRERLHKGTKN